MSGQRKHIEVVAAIIKKGDTILATQRGYGDLKDGWEFPGGKIEPGEAYDAALIREIKEELDVDIQVDGGINDETMETVMKAGANLLVAGSYVFSGDLETNVYSIQKKMDKIKSEID